MVDDVEKLRKEIKVIKGELKKTKKKKGFKKIGKILKKPKGKVVVGVSSEKTLRGFAHSTGPVVREVPKVEIVQDDRSQFFKDEFKKEEMGVNKWMS